MVQGKDIELFGSEFAAGPKRDDKGVRSLLKGQAKAKRKKRG